MSRIRKLGRSKYSTELSEGEAMLRELRYGALSGKTKAMYGKLLHFDDYMELIKKRNIRDVVSYLKYDTHYKAVLFDVDENNIHRGHLENVLRHDLINDYTKLLRFTSGNLKKFVDLMYIKIEVESLKLIFRVFEAGHAHEASLEDSLLFMAKCDKVNIPRLALSKNLEEFLAGLKNTIYYDVLRPFASEDNKTRLFSMEMALDLFYIRSLQNCYKNLLDSVDCAIVREFTGLESDIYNIFWLYRSKSFYKIDEEVIKSYTLPLIYKLKRSTLNDLIKAKNFEEFIEILRGTSYGFLFEGQNQLLYEHNYMEFIYRAYRIRFRTQPFTIASIVAYIRMKEMELSNIISIIEGIRYNLGEDNIRKFLVGLNSKM